MNTTSRQPLSWYHSNCDITVHHDGLYIKHDEYDLGVLTKEQSRDLAIEILQKQGWKVERIGTQTRAYAPEPESTPDSQCRKEDKQYPSKDIE